MVSAMYAWYTSETCASSLADKATAEPAAFGHHLPVMTQLADLDQRPGLNLILLVVAVHILSYALPEVLGSRLSDVDGATQQVCDPVVDAEQLLQCYPRTPTKHQNQHDMCC